MSPTALGVVSSARVSAAVGGGVTYQFIGTTTDFANVPIGIASSNRIVIIAYRALVYGSADPTSVTIGGISATIDYVGRTDPTNYTPYTVFAHAVVPTGTSANVVVNGVGAPIVAPGVAVWTVSGGIATVIDTDMALNIHNVPTVLTVTASTNTLVLAVFNTEIDWLPSTTWVGLTEDYDGLVGRYSSGASKAALAGDVSTTITFNDTVGQDRVDMIAFQIQ